MSAIGLPLTIEFGGGAELLFDGKKRHEVDLPGEEWTLKRLLSWLRDNLLTERPELFMQGDTVVKAIINYARGTKCSSSRRCTVDRRYEFPILKI
ncbi:PREDICTED: ubiquitin-related modifier 1 isoform X2 [Acromyrmex echinatior]|uniref:ubiquitin-related modifier 1 isoform X2 n=1 Tax=Acromyrmex echinatior TaxID=103372 RepID=UPI000580BF22|nr:PREDICTED: ubiquitin-related modifier 1 isoform X2 [Acromyrmex echinatior]